jgi:epoxyqueuosine reductase
VRLLVHSCCAPCSIEVFNILRPDCELTAFFYNPNIHPYKEFKRRLETLQAFTASISLPLVVMPDYDLETYLRGSLSAPERCAFCYRLRLNRTAGYARAQGFEAFTTSLLISPYQKHDLVRQAGEAAAAEAGVKFYYRDFRPGFRKSWNTAKELGLYCQNYCGCIFSEKERFYKTKD